MINYRRDIDGLRAIAVLSVLFFHAFPNQVPGGFLGVDIFFVLSGYLISNILFSQMNEGSIRWVSFYQQRIKRIFPALILVLFSIVVAGYFLLFPNEYESLGKHVLGSAAFVNNFILWHEAGYFDKASELKPLLHLWSLGIEEQFYFIWPLLIYVIWKIRWSPFIALSIFAITSFLLNLLLVKHHQIMAFYLPISRFWELALGGLLAYVLHHREFSLTAVVAGLKPSLQAHLFGVLSLISGVMLIFGVFLFSQRLNYPGWAALLPTMSTLVLLSVPSAWINRKILAHPLLTFVGLISYPLYLWHWALLSFAKIVYSGVVPVEIICSLIVVSFILAWLTYQWIEKPIRFSLHQKQQPYIVTILAICLLALGFSGSMITHQAGFQQRAFAKRNHIYLDDIKNFDAYKKTVVPCELIGQQNKLKKITACLQSKPGKVNRVIWGDSHAEHLFPGLAKLDSQNNWLLLEQTGCPPLLNVASYWKGSEDQCVQANDIILDAILNNPNIDTIVLASLGPFYISNHSYAAASQGEFAASKHYLQNKDPSVVKQMTKSAIFYHGLNATISKLQAAGKTVVLFQDIPELTFMPERCITRPLAPHKPCFIKKSDVEKRQKRYKQILETLKVEKHILVYNPINLLCGKKTCKLIENQHLIYRDSHHMSIAGSQYVVKKFLDLP